MTLNRITWDEAISPLNVAVAQHALRSLGMIRFENKGPIGKISDTAGSQYSLGLYYSEVLNEKDKALDVFSKLIKQYPKNIHPYISKGDLLRNKGEIRDSIKFYSQALEEVKINSQKGLILGKIGYSHFLLHNYKEATFFFQQALMFDGTKSEWHNNAGCCKILSGELEEGIGLLENALKISPNNFEIQLNKAYADLLQNGAKCLLDFVIFPSVQYSDPGVQSHTLDIVIDQYVTRNRDNPLDNHYFGLSYILIGDVEKGLTFFENKLDISMVPINYQIKKGAFDSVVNYILIDRPNLYEPFFFLLILNICGPTFVIDHIESSNAINTVNPPLYKNLLKFAKYVQNPDSESVMTPIVEYYQEVSPDFNYEKNKDPVFHKLFQDSSIWEKQGDEKLQAILQNFSRTCREYAESGGMGSIFDPVINIYQKILDDDPKCLRVKEKLADVYLMMGGKNRKMAFDLYKEILLVDPSNEHVIGEVQRMTLQPTNIQSLRESDMAKNQSRKRKKKVKRP